MNKFEKSKQAHKDLIEFLKLNLDSKTKWKAIFSTVLCDLLFFGIYLLVMYPAFEQYLFVPQVFLILTIITGCFLYLFSTLFSTYLYYSFLFSMCEELKTQPISLKDIRLSILLDYFMLGAVVIMVIVANVVIR